MYYHVLSQTLTVPFTSTRLIDWDFNFAQSLQKRVVLPKLLENVPGGAPPDVPGPLAYLDLAADKTFFLPALAEKEKEGLGMTRITRCQVDRDLEQPQLL